MNKKIGFIGVGNMGTAIISGMLDSKFAEPEYVYICDNNKDKCDFFLKKGVNVCDSITSLAECSDIVVLAVKPQNYAEVLTELSAINCESKIFVSIAAGISIGYVQKMLKEDAKVVRVMPNTPLLLSKGATALCPSDNMTEDEFKIVNDMFSISSVTEVFDESHMNEIISVNGSSPAYVYLFAKAMADYASECNIDADKAMNLICATFEGAAAMMRESGDDIETLIRKVSSPGGTTIAALNSFEENNFVDTVKKAMKACTDRAEELGK